MNNNLENVISYKHFALLILTYYCLIACVTAAN